MTSPSRTLLLVALLWSFAPASAARDARLQHGIELYEASQLTEAAAAFEALEHDAGLAGDDRAVARMYRSAVLLSLHHTLEARALLRSLFLELPGVEPDPIALPPEFIVFADQVKKQVDREKSPPKPVEPSQVEAPQPAPSSRPAPALRDQPAPPATPPRVETAPRRVGAPGWIWAPAAAGAVFATASVVVLLEDHRRADQLRAQAPIGPALSVYRAGRTFETQGLVYLGVGVAGVLSTGALMLAVAHQRPAGPQRSAWLWAPAVAGTAFGAAAVVLLLEDQRRANQLRSPSLLEGPGADAYREGRTAETLGLVSLGLGAAGVLTSTLLSLTSSSGVSPDAVTLRISAGPGSVLLQGRF